MACFEPEKLWKGTSFEYTLCRNRATASKRKCVTETFKERAAASERTTASDRKCATASINIF